MVHMHCGAMETTQDNGKGGDGGCYEGGEIGYNHGVTPFLNKLYSMVDDKSTNSIISWSSSRTTFIISDEQLLISKILPRYFKSNRLDSFFSQLNNYVSIVSS